MRTFKTVSFAIAIAIGLVTSTPALADWQYTTWQMSRAKVIQAAKGSAKAVEGQPGDRVFGADLRAEGAYTTLGFEFKAQYYFDATDRLRAVRIVLLDTSRCPELQATLEGLYGISGKDAHGATWLDVKNGNRVRFTYRDDCFVAYTPLNPEGGRGL